MNVARHLLDNAAPAERAALLTAAGTFTHGEVRRGAAAIAERLVASGCARGDRLLLLDQSSYFWVCAYLGALAAGCVAVPLPDTADPVQFGRILEQTEARGVFFGSAAGKRFAGAVPAGTLVFADAPGTMERPCEVLAPERLRGSAAAFDPVEVDDRNELAAIMFTSGSTGVPRGVMVSHRNIAANTESIVAYLRLDAEDRAMAFLPFHYCFGTSLLHTHLRVGGSLVVENSFLFPNAVLRRMAETGCTGMAGVPSHFQILLRRSSLASMSFPRLRWVQQAGGKLHDVFLEELRQALPGAAVYAMYGQTEATARLSYLPPELLGRKLGSIGKGIPGVRLEVLNGQGVAVRPGEVGEIVARGDNITLGYWREPEATAVTFRDGALHTGDLATVDDEGFIFIVDRAKDFIKCGGNRTSCRSIEDVVLRYPGMVEAAVVPRFDETLGEAVCLFAVHPDGEAVREDLVRFCGRNLPWDQVPRRLRFLPTLPRNFSGKVDKEALKQRANDDGSRDAAAVGPAGKENP